MTEISELQKRIFQNKVRQKFNTRKVEPELLYIMEELGEAVRAFRRDDEKFTEEIVDVIIFGLGLLEILKIDAEEEILKKVKKNESRVYTTGSKKIFGQIEQKA